MIEFIIGMFSFFFSGYNCYEIRKFAPKNEDKGLYSVILTRV